MTVFLAESVFLVSIYKPVLFAGLVGLWAYAVAYLDKDLEYFHMPRQMWNGINLGVGALAFLLTLVIPLFWLGFPLAVLMIAGNLFGYHRFRNMHVPKKDQWTLSLESFRRNWEDRAEENLLDKTSVALLGGDKKPILPPDSEDPRYPAHEAMEKMLDFAIPRQANRLEVAVDPQQAIAVVHIDGVRFPQPRMEPKVGVLLIDYLKEHAGLDVADRRKKQVGKLKVKTPLGVHELALTTMGSSRGLSLVMEVDAGKHQTLAYDKLGLLPSQQQQLDPVLDQEKGVVLVVAPPQQGLTTSLYALLSRHDPYVQHILTLEDEVKTELEAVNHTTIRTGPDEPPLAKQLNSMMLREPNVLMIGQLTDADTAKLIPDFSKEARFYVGLRQIDTLTAVKAWLAAVGDPKKAAESLQAVVAQRLIRKLCTTCRQAYTPDPAAMRKLNIKTGKDSKLYKHCGQVVIKEEPQPCPACMGLGYRGRTGVFEVMPLDDEARALIGSGELDQARSHLRKNKMLWLQEAALGKVVAGETSIAEITRALSGKKS